MQVRAFSVQQRKGPFHLIILYLNGCQAKLYISALYSNRRYLVIDLKDFEQFFSYYTPDIFLIHSLISAKVKKTQEPAPSPL